MLKNFLLTAWRNLVRNKTYAFLNITGLALGVAVCLLIGIWLHREFSYDNFHPKEEQLFRLANTFKSESESFSQAPTGPAFGGRLPQLLPAVASACRITQTSYKVTVGDQQFVEDGGIEADSNFFSFFGFKLMQGDPLICLQEANQVVITQSTAKKYFGDANPIGKTIQIDDQTSLVVSALAADAPVNSQIQFNMVMPMAHLRAFAQRQFNMNIDDLWVGGWMHTYLRLKDPAHAAQTQQQINQIAAKYSAKEWKENKMSYHYFLQPMREIHLNSHLRYDSPSNGSLSQVKIFSVIGLIVLMLACINYINLTTAGAIQRAKETSVRKVIGASKGQLLRQFFFETLSLCSIAVLLGIVLLKTTLPAFSAWIGQSYSFPLSGLTLGLLLGFVLMIALIAGLYPAALLSSFNPVTALKGQFAQGTRGAMIRKGLVVFQFTITIGLIASILIINNQMNFIRNRPLGFDPTMVLEVNYNGDQQVMNHYPAIKSALLKNTAILSLATQNQQMVGGLGNGWTTTENLAGEEISTSLYQMGVDEDYYKTYSMQLVAGRFFSPDFPTDSSKSVLVNEAAVRTFGWKTPQQALGKRFGKGDRTSYVIGVVKDFNFENLHKPVEALLIRHTRVGGMLSIKIDARHLNEAMSHVQQTWASMAPKVPLTYSFIDDNINRQYGNERKMQGLFYAFSGLSLLIACLGLFGLTTFVVERKVKEIGIRKVLGSSATGIVQLLSKEFLQLVLIAMVLASPIAWFFMDQWLKDFAYRTTIGIGTFVEAGLLAILIAMLTVGLRSLKAALANPIRSLRTE